MKRIRNFLPSLTGDKSFIEIVRNSGYLFSSNTISSILTTVQGILAAVILGPSNYGFLGLIVTFASNVNRLLSFRMGELVIKFAGSSLAEENPKKAARIIKVAGISEIITSLFAYGLLVLTAPLAAKFILKNEQLSHWIVIYGIALLANFATETSTAVLQLANSYKNIALLNLVQNIVTASFIIVLYFSKGDLYQVLIAYLVGKFIFGFGIFISALAKLKILVGEDWWMPSGRVLENKAELIKFALSTNLSGTVNLLIRDSEVLWIGYFWTPEIVGFYKFGLAIINPIMMPINTFITTTYPEINKLIALKLWNPLKKLLRKVTLVAFLWTAACTLGLFLVGPWILSLIKDGKYLPSLPITLILLIGYGTANILFWNRNLMLAFNQPNTPLLIMAIIGVIKTIAMFMWVPRFGYMFQAGLLSGYFVISVGIISMIGWFLVRRSDKMDKIPIG